MQGSPARCRFLEMLLLQIMSLTAVILEDTRILVFVSKSFHSSAYDAFVQTQE